jgi:hypothetical protein
MKKMLAIFCLLAAAYGSDSGRKRVNGPSQTEVREVIKVVVAKGHGRIVEFNVLDNDVMVVCSASYKPVTEGKNPEQALYVTIHPASEQGNGHYEYISDIGADGIVDSGTYGPHRKKWFRRGLTDEEWEAHWQQRYSIAITGILRNEHERLTTNPK